MSSHTPGNVLIGGHDVCYIRVGVLNDDCTPLYSATAGVITPGIVSVQASAEIEQGQTLDFKTGCGDIRMSIAKPDRTKRRNLSGVLLFHDIELLYLLGGGYSVAGTAANFTGKTVAWGEAGVGFYGSGQANPTVCLDFLVQAAADGTGDCSSGGSAPTYIMYTFPRVRCNIGNVNLQEGIITVPFDGKGTANPNIGSGPWRDYDNIMAMPFPTYSPMVITELSSLSVLNMGDGSVGWQTTPGAS